MLPTGGPVSYMHKIKVAQCAFLFSPARVLAKADRFLQFALDPVGPDQRYVGISHARWDV